MRSGILNKKINRRRILGIVSIDTETTGLNPNEDQVLEIAAVIDDFSGDNLKDIDDLPYFHCYVKHRKITGNLKALIMNQNLLKKIDSIDETDSRVETPKGAIKKFISFLTDNYGDFYKYTATGKNLAGFDFPFLDNLAPEYSDQFRFHFHHRILDVGSVYYDPYRDKNKLPNLQNCIDRAGIEKTVSHTALGDAKDVLLLLREYYFGG